MATLGVFEIPIPHSSDRLLTFCVNLYEYQPFLGLMVFFMKKKIQVEFYMLIIEPRHTKRSVKGFVIVISKEEWACVLYRKKDRSGRYFF